MPRPACRLLVLAVLLHISICQPAHKLAEEARERKHAVHFDWSTADKPLDLSSTSDVPDERLARSADTARRRFACVLPETSSSTHDSDSDSENELSHAASAAHINSLLDELSNRCFYTNTGWWTYEMCYKRHVRQLHVEKETIQTAFSLGQFSEEATQSLFNNNTRPYKDERLAKGDIRYTSHMMTGGTSCDMADVSRSAEVRFVCNQQQRRSFVSSVREPETCQYVITFNTPTICDHPAFQSANAETRLINCHAFTPAEEQSVDSDSNEELNWLDSVGLEAKDATEAYRAPSPASFRNVDVHIGDEL
jgi:protein OS-9